jgi:NADPH:quinone reductase-like Zn-dependent oxidoreductase
MRAYAIDEFGRPGSVRDLPTPEPKEGEVLLRVRAAGVNAFDAVVVNGYARDFMEHRFPLIPGLDASGVIEAVGPGVKGHAPGDEVYGVSHKPFQGEGAFAEFLTTPADALARKPSSVDHAGAAALPVAALTALSTIDATEPREGQAVVVLGATGGVGSYVTQLAGNRGARVAAVTRGENAEYARGLGASTVIDYTAGDLADLVQAVFPDGIDTLIDLVGDGTLVASLAALVRSGGRAVSAAGAVDESLLERFGLQGGPVNRAGLERLGELGRLVDDGQLRLPGIRTYSLDQAAEAIADQAARHVRGKLVLEVS